MLTGPMTVARQIATLISADHDVQAYCTGEYGKALTIMLGVDDNEQPAGSLVPLFDVRPGSYVLAADRTHRMVTVGCAMVIEQSGLSAIAGPAALAGLDSLEGLFARVEAVIEAWAKAEHNYQVAWGDSNTEISYPLFRITWTLTVQESAN